MFSPEKLHQRINDYMARLSETGHAASEDATGAIAALCHTASSADSVQAKIGTEALFRGIVEPLADRFETSLCKAYVEIFSQVIHFCRRQPRGRMLDEKLSQFRLHSQKDLLSRANSVRKPQVQDSLDPSRLRRILVLSRVTLGADIAVASVVLGKMKRFAPNAEIKLVGSTKAASFFSGDSSIGHLLFDYKREGSLLDRLDTWVALTETITSELHDLDQDEFLIVDPDSRLTQLGMLPLTLHDKGYCFLETRSFGAASKEVNPLSPSQYSEKSLPQLTASYLEFLFGEDHETVYPEIHLLPQELQLGKTMRQICGKKLAAVNFGVGANQAKRVNEKFEWELVKLLVDRGYQVLLDRGAGEDELRRMDDLEVILVNRGFSLSRIDSGVIKSTDIMTWEGDLSTFAGLISAADLYVGYDSAGGHLAAALEVPVVTVFAGAINRSMINRWTPWGRSKTHVIPVTAGQEDGYILQCVKEVLF